MRVSLFLNLVDPKWLALSMERYGFELKKNLEKLPREDFNLVSFQPHIPKVLTYLPTKWRYHLARYYYYPFFAQRNEGGVNHIIDHSFAQIAQFLNKEKTVVTCHDLIPLKHLNDGTLVEKDPFAQVEFRKSVAYLKEVRLVIADSNETKKDLISLLGIKEEKIRVIYLGRNDAFKILDNTDDIKLKIAVGSKPLLLHVGTNLPYKNIEKILAALKILKQEKIPFTFVKVGPQLTGAQKDLATEYGLIEDIVQPGFLTEKELIQLYNCSALLMYPSLFEGFGLPVLEAMSCGLSVLISKNTSLVEIVGEVLNGVDPGNENEIAQETKRILALTKEELRELKEKLLKQAEKFSWEKTARETYQVYEEINEN